MNVNSRGHNLDTRFEQRFPEIKHPPGPKTWGGIPSSSIQSEIRKDVLRPQVLGTFHRTYRENRHCNPEQRSYCQRADGPPLKCTTANYVNAKCHKDEERENRNEQ